MQAVHTTDASRWRLRASSLVRWLEPALVVVSVVLAAVPFARLATSVRRWSIDVPFNDQWSLVPLLEKARTPGGLLGQVGFGDLFATHHEHRLFFPRLLMISLARVTDWNTRAEMAVSVGLAVLAFVALALLARSTSRFVGRGPLLALPLVSALFFSKTQAENFLWGWQVQILLCLFGVVGVCALLGVDAWTSRGYFWRVFGAICCALLAQYSFANGVLAWVVGLFLLAAAVRPDEVSRQGKSRAIGWWIVAGTASTFAYFWQWGEQSGGKDVAESPMRSLEYAAVFLGAPTTRRTFDCVPSGQRCDDVIADARLRGIVVVAMLTVAFLILWRRGMVRAARGWIGLAAFGVGSAVVASAGRSEIGIQQALESRYTTIATTAWIGAVMLVVCVVGSFVFDNGVRRERAASVATFAVSGLLALGLISMTTPWQLWFTGRHDGLLVARETLLNPKATDAELAPNADPPSVRAYSKILREKQLSVFRDPNVKDGKPKPTSETKPVPVPKA